VVDIVMGEEEDGQLQKEVLGDGGMSGGDMEVEMGDRVREAAAVSKAIKVQVRTSPRLQRSKDEHILAKAEERVAKKNLEFNEGNPCSTSLFSVNKDLALDCLQNIGINLGVFSVEKDINLYNLVELESEMEVGELGSLNRIGENTTMRRRVGRTWRKKL
jgi:purine-nucleoside phosphorylase